MKKLICLFLALAALCSLAACQKDLNIGQTEPTTIEVNDEDLNKALGNLEGDLDAAMQDALNKALGQGVTIPENVPPPQTMPPPMPTGVEAKLEDVYPLVEEVHKILNSGTYLLKARGSTPPSSGMPLGTTPVTFAVDKDKTAFEADMDWINMFKTMTEGTTEYNMATIRGATMQTLFGKKVRFVSKPDGDLIMFLDKKTFAPIPAPESEEGESPMSMAGMFGEAFTPKTSGSPESVTPSKVAYNGKEYLCAEVKGTDGLTMLYYFLDKQLKRIEMKAKDPDSGKLETMVFEIDSLTGTVDPAFFSTAGFKAMPLDQLGQLTDSMGGLFE